MRELTKFFAVLGICVILCLSITPVLAAPARSTGDTGPQNALENLRNEANYTTTDLITFIGRIIKWVLGIIGVIMIALFVYGGVTYATSAGSEEKIENGKKIMVYTIIGVVIIALAYVLTDFIIQALFPTF
ncbi:MAG: pilin [Patescibacteria group bacterium]|nr:pilin [Patescibacteria group bacterium]